MNDEVIWLTYDALAERLGIERESARQRARRGMWARRKDNAGRLTVAVPVEVVETTPEQLPVARLDPLLDEGEAGRVALHDTDVTRYLNRYIETMIALERIRWDKMILSGFSLVATASRSMRSFSAFRQLSTSAGRNSALGVGSPA